MACGLDAGVGRLPADDAAQSAQMIAWAGRVAATE